MTVDDTYALNSIQSLKWHIIHGSVQGYSHIHSGLPNQDHLAWWFESFGPDGYEQLVLAIADGHGDSTSFRSKKGAAVATSIAISVIRDFFKDHKVQSDFKLIRDVSKEKIPKEISNRWNETIEEEIGKNPFTKEEIYKLKKKKGERAVETVKKHPLIVYGTTLLIVFISKTFIIYLQIGDGDILRVSEDGTITKPIPVDERLLGNETTSLCNENAWQNFRVAFEQITDKSPALILASTDGYSNSFENSKEFEKVGSDLLEELLSNGPRLIEDNIEEWLSETSENGSGDDITAGIIFRSDLSNKNLKNT